MDAEDIATKLSLKFLEAIDVAIEDGASPWDVHCALQAAIGYVLDHLGADDREAAADVFAAGIQTTLQSVEAMKEEEDVEGYMH